MRDAARVEIMDASSDRSIRGADATEGSLSCAAADQFVNERLNSSLEPWRHCTLDTDCSEFLPLVACSNEHSSVKLEYCPRAIAQGEAAAANAWLEGLAAEICPMFGRVGCRSVASCKSVTHRCVSARCTSVAE